MDFCSSKLGKHDSNSEQSLYCKGSLGFNDITGATDTRSLQEYQRLVATHMSSFTQNQDFEVLKGQRLYGFFTCIVDYKDMFKGVCTITVSGLQTAAEISIPNRPDSRQSTVAGICDTIVLDNFIHVAGYAIFLHVNRGRSTQW